MKNIYVRNVLVNLDLTMEKGEFLLVLGDNGAGKTTLFNTISGAIQPSQGSIFIDSEDVTDKTQFQRANLVANVFQDPKVGTVSKMTLRENMNLAYMRGKKRALSACCSEERDELFREKLSELKMGLEDRLDSYAGELSGGQRQALSIAMAFLTDSKILLLDEITAALDRVNSEKIMNIVYKKCQRTCKTCLMITHSPRIIEQFENNVAVLENGKIFKSFQKKHQLKESVNSLNFTKY